MRNIWNFSLFNSSWEAPFFHAAVKNLLKLFVCNTFKHVVSYCNCLQSLVDPFKSGVRLKQLKITIISNILIEKDHIVDR